jgi:hypothetical protein
MEFLKEKKNNFVGKTSNEKRTKERDSTQIKLQFHAIP